MRIIAGSFRGRPLVAPIGRATRPTATRTREAIFNILQHAAWGKNLEGLHVLDLFAGSGALGLEAVSRGAAFALFVETQPEARAAIRSNIEALGIFGNTRIHRRDAKDLGARPAGLGQGFDLVFADPPYGQNLLGAALTGLIQGKWLAPNAVICAETAPQDGQAWPGFETLDTRRYGSAQLTFLAQHRGEALP